MKGAAQLLFVTLACLLAPSALAEEGDRTITRVVKLLQGMLDKSKADGDADRGMYAKFKCYCDKNEDEKKASIDTLGQQIELLGSQIEDLQGKNGGLSSEVAKLTAEIAANEQARTEAEAIRKKENEAFVAMETDSVAAIGQMGEAISTLSEIGADQTLGNAAADHEALMAGHDTGLLKLKTKVKKALLAASAFVSKKQVKLVESFLQGPSFTGHYTSASGEVVGILKDMKATFENNLANAVTAEKASAEAHEAFMDTKVEEHGKMSAAYEEKQGLLSGHDEALASAMEEKTTAEDLKAGDEAFLASLIDMCAEKAKDYEKRVAMRANEDTALTQAIAILNSDAAFETFGKVDATKTGDTGASFFQRRAIKAHVQAAAPAKKDDRRLRAQSLLRKASSRHQSMALASVFAMLAANNPFAVVLTEISKMVALISKEEEADQKQFDWCATERETKNADLETKQGEITELESAISELEIAIDSPTEGLKFLITETEDALVANRESQATETASRKEEHAVYLMDTHHLSEAESLLDNAIKVLEKYYAKILKEEEAGLLQKKREEPAPPETWENGKYEGQSAGGGDAISMLKYIMDNTKAEETTAHEQEFTSQKDFETAMTDLKTQEAEKEGSLTDLRATLAEKEKELFQKKADLEATSADAASIEAYLEKIKPGCDFITENHETRKSNRASETAALEQASEMLKGSPAYQTFEAQAHNETMGDCLSKCTGAEETAECKACLAGVSVPGYCAGHPGTAGC